jgi:hypothetical protein
MNGKCRIDIPTDMIADFCRRWKIKELDLFGSVLRDDFRADSDVDVLVEFSSDATWSLFDLGPKRGPKRGQATFLGKVCGAGRGAGGWRGGRARNGS